MNEYRSNVNGIHEHPNFVLALATELDVGADWLFGYLEGEVRNGVIFRAGQTIQIGWMLIKLVADDGGDLEIWEPSFGAMPIEWVRGATNTFRYLTLQREVCSQVGVDPTFPSLTQSGVVSMNFLAERGDFVMSRDDPEFLDSGWVFTVKNEVGFGAGHSSLFEIASFEPKVIAFLALPASVSVHVSDGEIDVYLASRRISSESNEFLQKLLG